MLNMELYLKLLLLKWFLFLHFVIFVNGVVTRVLSKQYFIHPHNEVKGAYTGISDHHWPLSVHISEETESYLDVLKRTASLRWLNMTLITVLKLLPLIPTVAFKEVFCCLRLLNRKMWKPIKNEMAHLTLTQCCY